jgi:imidazolonepropionase-like amidohydrolase
MAQRTCFINANLLDGEHPAKPGSSIVVEGDRVTTVTTAEVVTEPGDTVVDCAGRTLMPGMTTGHWHPAYDNVDGTLMPPLGFERAPALHAYLAAYNGLRAIKAGVTSVVGANAPFDIEPSLRDAIEEGWVVGPRIVPGSRDLITTADSNDTTPWWWESTVLAGVRTCDGADGFRKGVRDEVHRGAEVIKLFPTGGHGVRLSGTTMSMTQAEINAAAEAAHGLGVRVRAHVGCREGILRCLEAGVDIIDHADGIDEECIKGMAEQGTILVPSIVTQVKLIEGLKGEAPDNEQIASLLNDFDDLRRMLPLCMEAGLTVALGDDYGNFLMPHGTYGEEPAMLLEYAGIPALEVLRWATVCGGTLVGREDLGRIEEGYLADLIVVDGDPSEDLKVLASIDNIHAVMRDGKMLVNTVA